MKLKTRSKAVLAGAMAVGLGFVAVPAATAALGDDPTIEITSSDVVTTEAWQDDIEFAFALPADVTPDQIVGVQVSLSVAVGENAGAGLDEVVFEPVDAVDGVYTGTVNFPEAPEVFDETGYPAYGISGTYAYEVEGSEELEYKFASAPVYVIDAERSISGPAEATVAELAEGVEILAQGFQPGEEVTVTTVINGEQTDESVLAAGEDGRTGGSLTATGVAVGDQVVVTATGADGESVSHTVTVVAEGGDDDEGDDDQPSNPTPPEQVETGL